MSKSKEMINVANSCPGYTPDDFSFQSSTGQADVKSCTNCRNLQDGKCVKNLYDRVAASH